MKYGRYEIVSELGKGAMGVVYKAHDPQIDRTVALKALRQEYADKDYFVQRFFKEAKAIGRLSHPGIVTVYDVGQSEQTLYIAMEFLSGTPLNEVLREGKPSLNQVIDLGIQVAEALDYAQGKGVVHRDIKPANIIVTDEGQAKLTDFGIAHIEDVSATLQTQAGEILGTPVYMSPEQVLGKTPDGRSDLYSLGVILYELSTGRRPFSGANMALIFRAVTQEAPVLAHEADPDIPDALSAVIMKCLEKSPENRFQTGRELAEALRACQQHSPTEKAMPAAPARRRFIPYTLLSVAVVSICLAVGIWVYQRNISPPPEPVIPKGTLAIASDPAKALVYVSGVLRGETPLALELPLDKYEIRIHLENHFDWEAQIQLDQPGETPLFVRLNPTTLE